MSSIRFSELQERTRLEGNGFSQLRDAIAQTGYNDFDRYELGTIVAPPPSLRLKIDNVDNVVFEESDVIVAEHLTRHKRIVTIAHEELAKRNLGDKIVEDGLDTDDMIEGNPITHYRHQYVELTFEDVLKPGDRVLIASMNGGQTYVILDRTVTYGAITT